MEDASPEVLRVSMEDAPDIHAKLTSYMVTPDGGEVKIGQLIFQ